MSKKNVLKAYLKKIGLSQEEVAKIWGTSKSSTWRKLTHPEKITLKDLVVLGWMIPEKTYYSRCMLVLQAFDAAESSINNQLNEGIKIY